MSPSIFKHIVTLEGLRDHTLWPNAVMETFWSPLHPPTSVSGPIHFLFLTLFPFVSSVFSAYLSLWPSFPKVWDLCWENEKQTMRSVMNGLRVPWVQYILPLSLCLLPMEAMGSSPVISHFHKYYLRCILYIYYYPSLIHQLTFYDNFSSKLFYLCQNSCFYWLF